MTHTLTLTIESISSEGQGVARHDGLVYFVEGAAPGETVTAEIVEKKKNFARARLLSITTASSARITPPCPYYEHCGGCTYQHISYDEQLRIKQRQVIDAFTRIGKIANPPIATVVASPAPFAYRNRITLHKRPSQPGTIGFFTRANETIIPIERCLLAQEQLNNALHSINERGNTYPNGDITLCCDTTDVLAHIESLHHGKPSRKGSTVQIIAPDLTGPLPVEQYLRSALASQLPCLSYVTDTVTLYYAPSSFFQINNAQLTNIAQYLRAHCPDGNMHLIDLYCGVGSFGILLHGRYEHVIGIEENADAIEFARMNAHVNACAEKVRFICSDAAKATTSLFTDRRPDDCDVIIDPPRAGMASEIKAALLRHRPRRIIYISCDPATAARDLAALLTAYDLTSCTPFDMFPQTNHIETVSLLRRK